MVVPGHLNVLGAPMPSQAHFFLAFLPVLGFVPFLAFARALARAAFAKPFF